MRKTKIIATLGPAVDDPGILKELVAAGLDVARFNFSHGKYDEHLVRLTELRKAAKAAGRTVGVLADTRGPEVRLGVFPDGFVELNTDDSFVLTVKDVPCNAERASVSYPDLPKDVSRGVRILLDDGLISLIVENVMGDDIVTRVQNGGKISSRKSINVPGVKLSLPFISSHDRADLRFIVENKFDFIAASFTRTAEDILHLRAELERLDGKHIKIISKIENAEGVSNISAILDVSDGIMVARGDMGVEIPFEEVPIIQKKLIKMAYTQGKHVITATQMLESMMKNPRPTRAEVCDVANAVYDGTSAIMLSGETAAGAYPVEAVATMASIAVTAENDINYKTRLLKREDDHDFSTITNAISHATCTSAHDLGAKAILTVTNSGRTARNISKFRPSCPIIGCTPFELVRNQLCLSWGVMPLIVPEQPDTDSLFKYSIEAAKDAGLLIDGDLVVITAGVPVGKTGSTNLLKVHVVGDPLTT